MKKNDSVTFELSKSDELNKESKNLSYTAELLLTEKNLLVYCTWKGKLRIFEIGKSQEEVTKTEVFKNDGRLYLSFCVIDYLRIYGGTISGIDIIHLGAKKIEYDFINLKDQRKGQFFIAYLAKMGSQERPILLAVMKAIKSDDAEEQNYDSLVLIKEVPNKPDISLKNKPEISIINIPKGYYVTSFDALPMNKAVLALVKCNEEKTDIEVGLIEIKNSELEGGAFAAKFESFFSEHYQTLTDNMKINTISLHYSGLFLAVGCYGCVDVFAIHKKSFKLQLIVKIPNNDDHLSRIERVLLFPQKTKADQIDYSLVVLNSEGDYFVYDLISSERILTSTHTQSDFDSQIISDMRWDAQGNNLVLFCRNKEKKYSCKLVKAREIFPIN